VISLLENTGERIIPEFMKPTNGLYLEHIARYYFSIPYIKGRVLDLACGSGYGTQFIAKSTKKTTTEVIGVDIDSSTIAYAKKTYHHPLVSYQIEDALDENLPRKLGQFDTILSFETIEHVLDDHLFMNNIYNMLRPGGILVLSTPFGQGRGKPCGSPFHAHQLTDQEFKDLFDGFKSCEIYYQRGVTIEPPREGLKYPLGVSVCIK
jgi:2-polyprenyl-3-methyl-5-hydroxy-6-metoxy-1,4-benzoquinol methylase